jgi:hypothetical protein
MMVFKVMIMVYDDGMMLINDINDSDGGDDHDDLFKLNILLLK